jgi:hypothetical protein
MHQKKVRYGVACWVDDRCSIHKNGETGWFGPVFEKYRILLHLYGKEQDEVNRDIVLTGDVQ